MLNKQLSPWLFFLVIIIASIIAYSNTFNASFQFDDIRVILEDPHIKNRVFLHSREFWTSLILRPLALYSFSIDYAISGASPVSYHITNLLIHLTTGGVLFFLLSYILTLNKLKAKYQWVPIIAMAFFLLHPIQTQAVTYIVQRMTSLFVLFYFLSLLFYLKGRYAFLHKKNIIRSILFLALAGFSAILAILSKQTAASLPIMMLACEIFLIRKPDGTPPRYMIILQSGIFAIGLIYLFTIAKLPSAAFGVSRLNYFITEQLVFLQYLKLIIFPVNQNIDHLFPLSETLWATKELVSVSIVSLILISGVFIAFRNRLLAFGIFSIFIGLSIESTIFPITDTMVEHRLYLPMIGFSLLAAIGLNKLINVKFGRPALIGLFIILGTATFSRNADWATQESLWLDSANTNPDNYRAWNNYGYSLLSQERYAEAIEAYKKSLYLNASNKNALDNLAFIYIQLGDYAKAEQYTKGLLHLSPKYAEGYANYALLELGRKRYDEAESKIKIAIKLKTNYYKYYFIYAQICLDQNKHDYALVMLEKCLALKPDFNQAKDLLSSRGNKHHHPQH